tara:strand:- start:6939 stop:7196 length:258 start_codon:yes stop_codon:yes gene_type:complete
MQSIITSFLGPTDHRGSRIIAKTSGGFKKTYPYDHRLSGEKNHASASLSLLKVLDWEGELIGGIIADSKMAWVFIDKGNPIIKTK